MENKKLLEEAKKMINDPDIIVNAFDLMIEWHNTKICSALGYDNNEMMNKNTLMLHSDDSANALKTEMAILNAKKGIEIEIPLKTKGGEEKKITFMIYHFEFQNNPYMVGKILKINN